MKIKLLSIALFLIFFCNFDSFSSDVKDLNFKPFIANIYESRMGALFTDNNKKLRLDIGGSYDLYQSEFDENKSVSFGADFFTFTRLRSEGNFKFPVETTDFYFGVNGSYISKNDFAQMETRLRIAHVSTHLSDGFSSSGIFYKLPFVYSKEFVDLAFAIRKDGFRPYVGFTAIFSYLPKNINLFVPQIGFEYEKPVLDWLNFKFAYDFKLNGYDSKYLGMNNLTTGLEFKTSENRGVFLKVDYYSGEDYYGQFYKDYNSYLGLGFEVEFN